MVVLMCLPIFEIQTTTTSSSSQTSILPQLLYAAAIIVGALIGSFSSYPSRRIQIWFKRKKLRRALYSEINGLDWLAEPYTDLDELREDIKEATVPTHTYIPREVYETELENIGLLSQHEIDTIHNYYRMTSIAKEQLETMYESNADDERIRETFANKTIYQLNDRRDAAIKALSKEM